MTYQEARAFVECLKPRGIMPGLDNVARLAAELGNPQNKLNIIHIAGTNGKGSIGAFLEAILKAADRSTGRFVSPSVGCYEETFTCNGIPVSNDLYIKVTEKAKAAIERLAEEDIFPTSFEAETVMAFMMFCELQPDYVLIECGMGGRLDATNIIPMPRVSVISSISSDHTQFLGSTLSDIAQEKAGIIKPGCPVVTCSQADEVMEVLANTAKLYDVPLYIADDIENAVFHDDCSEFDFEGVGYSISLAGTYQPQNAAVAIKTAQLLGINSSAIKTGLKNTVWRYRFERIGKYILDGAHNEGAAYQLAASLREYTSGSTAFICGCFRDKAYEKIAEITSPCAQAVYCIKPPTERGLDAQKLCGAFAKYTDNSYCRASIANAIRDADKYDNIVIFGSLSILGEARTIIDEQ